MAMSSEDRSGSWVKTLWIREPSLAQILAGRKTVEVRVSYDNIRRLQPGDRLNLNDRHLAVVRRIGRYADFQELVAHEDPAAIAPDLAASVEQGLAPDALLAALRAIYPPEKEALGAIALELALLPPAGWAERRYDAVLFDMGYTLVYFDPPQEIIAQEALRAIGAERSVDEIGAAVEAVYGAYYRDAATVTFPATAEHDRQAQAELERRLLARLGLATDPETSQAFTAAADERYGRPGAIRPYPEVVDVLAALQGRGYRLGIISNWSWNLQKRVGQATLDGYFELVWASAYAGCHKPHPGIFRQALARMDVAPGRALYVGDSYWHDVLGARSAGVDAALLDRDGAAGDRDCPVIRDLWGVLDLIGESR
jgi:putative hydrolase of the HAD superfamily